MMPNKFKGYLLAFIGSVGSGIFTIFFLISGEHTTPIFSVFMIFVWALFFNVIFGLFFTGKNSRKFTPADIPRKDKIKIGLAFLFIFISTVSGNYFYQLALKISDPIIVQASNRFEIIFVVFMGWLVYKEHLSPRFWIGTVIVIGGFLFSKMNDTDVTLLSWQGIMFGILSGISFGVFQTVTKYLIRFLTPSDINKYRLIISICILIFFPGIFNEIMGLTPEIIFYTGLAALTGPFISRLSYMNAIKYVEISHSILFTALAPFITGILQVVFLKIPVKPLELIGIVIVVFGISISIRYDNKKKLPATN